MDLSVVTTLYRSSKYISEFHRRMSSEVQGLTQSYEIIYVNDGSPDDSLNVVREVCAKDHRVKILDLSRNFGQHRAMMCGIRHAIGDRVFLIDVDLEEVPESLGKFWEAMEADPEADVVVGTIAEKTVPFFKKATSELFYKVFNTFSSVKISNRELVSRLMKRSYVNALIEYREREVFIPAIWVDAGFNQKKVLSTKTFDGNSSYTLRKKLVMAMEAITSFSNKPLVSIFYVGLLFSLGSLLFIIYLVSRKLLLGQVVLGWTSVMAALFLIGGFIIFSLGIVGIYVSKIYLEVKARPRSIVRKVYQSDYPNKEIVEIDS